MSSVSTGGSSLGGSSATGGTDEVGTGGNDGTGGNTSTGGNEGTGGSTPSGDCTFTVNSETSSAIPTVGIVTWSTDLASITEAKIQFELADGSGSMMEAPVDLEDTSGSDFRTLLLGMKAQKTYSYRIIANSGSTSCTSEDYSITTGALASGVPSVSRQVTNAQALAGGFIVTNSGSMGGGGGGGGSMALIIDADGDVVWWAAAPSGTSRAHMTYDGKRMWMLTLNVGNSGGEMRWVSMDGLDGQNNVSGLSGAHHDFCITSNNTVAALLWASNGQDPPSNLVEVDPDGNLTTVGTIDSSVYQSSSFHANAIHYNPPDDTFTISDRNPNLFVKVDHQGRPLWQFGGSCTNAPAPKCVAGSWQVNHGHHWLEDGYFVFFNNGGGGGGPGGGGGSSTIYAYQLDESGSSFSATQLWSYAGGSSGTLGDVQALPNGNTLITYSNSGSIVELDSSQSVVQTMSSNGFGYADWRQSLYGAPNRL